VVLRPARLLPVAAQLGAVADRAKVAIKPRVPHRIRLKAAVVALLEEEEPQLPRVSPVKPAFPATCRSNP
jgi:hypothetical protein